MAPGADWLVRPFREPPLRGCIYIRLAQRLRTAVWTIDGPLAGVAQAYGFAVQFLT